MIREKIDATTLKKIMDSIFIMVDDMSLLLSFQHICFINKDSFYIFENYITKPYLLDRINVMKSGVNLDENSNFGQTCFMENKLSNVFTLERDEEFENIFKTLDFFGEYNDIDTDTNNIAGNNPNLNINDLLQTIINEFSNNNVNKDKSVDKNER
jgi:hypothetical protein